MNIGILVIATNKYIKFLNPLVDSINKYFLKEHNKTIFCFTDIMEHIVSNNVVKIYQQHMPWPFTTLKRYEIFYNNKNEYKDIDILYYMDVDMLINDYIGDEFLPDDKNLIAVIHPGYRRDLLQSFERFPYSTACVFGNDEYIYHCGGIQGGKINNYLDVCDILSKNIIDDLNRGIIAIWHDESHWNKYLISNPNSYKELDCDYCYPENWDIPFKKIILALDKNHSEMRN